MHFRLHFLSYRQNYQPFDTCKSTVYLIKCRLPQLNDKEGVILITKCKVKPTFQLIETPAIDGMSKSVFSIIGLYPKEDFPESTLAYDVSRNKEKAESVLASLLRCLPERCDFYDFIGELL